MECAISLWFAPPTPPLPNPSPRSCWQKVALVAKTIFYLLISPLTAIFFGIGLLLELQKQHSFTYLEGAKKGKNRQLKSLMTWNVCMLLGGLPIPFGGVVPSRERIQFVQQRILDKASDLVVLQEVSEDAAYELYDALKSSYSFFYIKILPGPLFDSGLFVASKIPVSHPQVIPLPSSNSLKRAAFTCDFSNCSLTTTHLEAGNDQKSADLRQNQIDTILKVIKVNKALFVGDLNMERQEFQRTPLANHFRDTLAPEVPTTATDFFSAKLRKIPPTNYKIDYIGATPEIALTTKLRKGYFQDQDFAYSDHHLLFATLDEKSSHS